jgi:predicted nucleotidyltransferase
MQAAREVGSIGGQSKHRPHLRANEKAGLTALVRELRAHYGSDLQRVVLFGSKARGDFDKESDLDLLVIIRMRNGDYRQYWNEIVDIAWRVELTYGIVTSLVIKDVADYDAMREHQLLLARNIEQDGVDLWTMPLSALTSKPASPKLATIS